MRQKNTKKQIFLVLIFLAISVLFSGCVQSNAAETPPQSAGSAALEQQSEQGNTNNSVDTPAVSGEIKKVEVIHFHGTHQCYSCITVGDYAEETVNTFFSDELESGKIVFMHINGELPENQEAVQKYGAAGSSLWIGTYTADGKFSKEQNINVWYKIGDEQEYMNYLKSVIEQKLKGE